MTIQAPVQYRVTTSPTRAGSYPAPYTLINLSTEHTAWIANNAGLQIGQGTPLYPGTSLSWTQEGELWVVGSGDFDILVSYDVVDWEPNPAAIAAAIINSGVIVIDHPELLASYFITSGNQDMGIIDISRFQSISVNIGITVGGSHALDQLKFQFSSSETGRPVSSFPILFKNVDHSGPVLAGTWQGTFPAVSDQLELEVGTIDAAIINIEIYGSHRPIEQMQQSIGWSGYETDFLRLNLDGFTGTSNDFQLPPWHGEIEIDCRLVIPAADADATPYIVINSPDPVGPGINVRDIYPETYSIGGSVLHRIYSRIMSNGDALIVRLNLTNVDNPLINNSGIRITPVTGGPV